ncbi:hypothetical protein ACXAPX_003484 [Escherichia coli]
MAIKIQCYTESDNAAFFGDDSDLQHQLPAPTYDELRITVKEIGE